MSDDNLPVILAEGLALTMDAETEAHSKRLDKPSESRPDAPGTDAHAALHIAFPPGTPEGRYELTYRPAATSDGRPELELHGRVWSDRRLKRDVRPLVVG